MTAPSAFQWFSSLGVMAPPGVGLVLWLALGVAAGGVHFALLRWNATLYVTASPGRGIVVQILRMAATASLLCFAAWHGVLPLLIATVGLLLARAVVLHVTEMAP